MLRRDFVVGWRNIVDQKYVGDSSGYRFDQAAVGTTNGAGGRNIQLFMLSPDGIVLNCLPGYWHPEDLAREMELAKMLHEVWRDASLSRERKRQLFTRHHIAAARYAPRTTAMRSGWQGFDARNERARLEQGPRDTFVTRNGQLARDRNGNAVLKRVDEVVHDRLAERPFVAYRSFDTAVFADYGRPYYDNNRRIDATGKPFETAGRKERRKGNRGKGNIGRGNVGGAPKKPKAPNAQ